MDKKFHLEKHRDRAIKTILNYKDKNCNNYLPPKISSELREIIMSEINLFCTFVFDLLEDEDVIFNEVLLERLDRLDEQMQELLEDEWLDGTQEDQTDVVEIDTATMSRTTLG